MMSSILFTPDIDLDSEKIPMFVPIKGQVPQIVYPFALKDIWNIVSSLDPFFTYKEICKQFDRVEQIFSNRLQLRPYRSLPKVWQSKDAIAILGVLFDPQCFFTDDLWNYRLIAKPIQKGLLKVETAWPFPLRCASSHKLLHTLVWVDTNIKLHVEKIANCCSLTPPMIFQIVEVAMTIYSLLLKCQNYLLAQTINFNYSMFIQDRILNLIFGDKLYQAGVSSTVKGNISNRMALELIKGSPRISLRELCLSSIFMGVIWTGDESFQKYFMNKPDVVLGDLESQLKSEGNKLAIDDIDKFIAEIGAANDVRAVVVLDDNGESVFDVALFQRLLNDVAGLKVTFVVNRFPVSNNISEEILRVLLEDPFFSDLKNMMQMGRVNISIEQQMFRSFEMEHLTAETLHCIESSTLVYVKGANFFETFQGKEWNVYHVFTVYGEMSMTLTGYPQGSGIFVRLSPGRIPFVYKNSFNVVTLKELIKPQMSEGTNDAS